MLGVVILLHDLLSLETQFSDRCLDVFLYNLLVIAVPSMIASRPGPDSAKQAQTMILPPLCFTDGIGFLCCVLFSKHNASHLKQKVLFWSHPFTKHFSNSPLACLHEQWLSP